MSLEIWKYPIRHPGRNGLEVPEGASVLSVHLQGSVPQVWMLVDPEHRRIHRGIFAAMTGDELPRWCQANKFIGTVLMEDGQFVLHVFDVGDI